MDWGLLGLARVRNGGSPSSSVFLSLPLVLACVPEYVGFCGCVWQWSPSPSLTQCQRQPSEAEIWKVLSSRVLGPLGYLVPIELVSRSGGLSMSMRGTERRELNSTGRERTSWVPQTYEWARPAGPFPLPHLWDAEASRDQDGL